MKYAVEPASDDQTVPPHPIEGPMPPEGAEWIADQYTLRLIIDGVIRRVDEKAEPAGDVSASDTKAGEAQAAFPASAEPAPGTVASVPFMITAAMRKRLRALGKTDDEISQMKPEEAQAALVPSDAPASGEAQEH